MKCLEWIDHLPAGLRIRRLFETIWAEITFPQSSAPGHFYSPIPARAELERDRDRIFRSRIERLPEIDLCEEEQLQLLRELAVHVRRLNLPETAVAGRRYYLRNCYFMAADAMVLATMLMQHKPRRYLEIGSGFSSALALDTGDSQLSGGMQCTFIEPRADRLRELLQSDDSGRVTILETQVQDVPDSEFQKLEAGDILFVDGSHVVKIGSDLHDVVFRILPLLRRGVLIHFHDILWPFEYAERDVLRGFSWNEAYLLRAFLANNTSYAIYCFGSWLEECRPAEWHGAFPRVEQSTASSLWLRKVS